MNSLQGKEWDEIKVNKLSCQLNQITMLSQPNWIRKNKSEEDKNDGDLNVDGNFQNSTWSDTHI